MFQKTDTFGSVHLSKEEIRKEHNEKLKSIDVEYILTREVKTINVQLKEKVKDVKRKIENEFGFDYGYLDQYKLRITLEGKRESKLLTDDNLSLEQYHVKNHSTIVFGKEKNSGGNFNNKLFYF